MRSRRGQDSFLVLILLLLAFELWRIVWFWEYIDLWDYTSLVVVLMLLINHVAFQYAKTGKLHAVMKQVAIVWLVLGSIYIVVALFQLNQV